MFFQINNESVTRILKASRYDELVLKAATTFKLNPNSVTLTYNEPNGEKIVLDSEDTYEYVEQRY
jgi:hypothetical protein